MNGDAVARLKEVLSRYAPAVAVDRLADYIVLRGVHLRITIQRRSKYGDYRCPRRGQQFHAISVNGNLNAYFFLLVLLHEMAHLETYLLYKNGVKPHGHEWQEQYRGLLRGYADCFPEEAQALLARYVARIPLHGPTGQQLDHLLKNYGSPQVVFSALTLDALHAGDIFRLVENPQKRFIVVEKRRTRWLCMDADTRRPYSVKGTAEVILE